MVESSNSSCDGRCIAKSRNGAVPLLILLGLLLTQTYLVLTIAWRKSSTNDENAHIAAAVFYLQYQRFELYRVNPPLVRYFAGVPVLLAGCQTDWRQFDRTDGFRREWQIGTEFMAINREKSHVLLFLARCGCLPFALLGTLLIWEWTNRLAGPSAAAAASAIWVVNPTILGNAGLVTCDVPASVMGLLAARQFCAWLRSPQWLNAFVAGISLGLAFGTKTVWIILPALWISVSIVARVIASAPRFGKMELLQWSLIGLVSLVTLNTLYGFEGCGTKLGEFSFKSLALAGADDKQPANRFSNGLFADLPVPLPVSFVLGIDEQRVDFEREYGGYIHGSHYSKGVWWYYFFCFCVKEPVCQIAIACLGGLFAIRKWFVAPEKNRVPRADTVVLFAHATAIILLISWQSGLNSYYRYALPAFPFLIVLTVALLMAPHRSVGLRRMVWCLILGSALESLIIWPHSLSFFNLAVGGPVQGGRYLLGSNLDWGQELKELESWSAAHPHATPLYLIHTELSTPNLYQINWQDAPFLSGQSISVEDEVATTDEPPPGWYVVSPNYIYTTDVEVTVHTKSNNPRVAPRYAEYFRTISPTDHAGYGLLIYQVEKL
ncbi:MAG: glycosyltransferase family 39 protein [Planctomyces sp.]|nr:glycosyltransferase family 39 protein [Planctomyces sp.]